MSWSVALIGNPSKIAAALDKESARLEGQCKLEFDAALPHLKGLLAENFVADDATPGYPDPVLHLTAAGSGYQAGGKQVYRTCLAKIESLHGQLV